MQTRDRTDASSVVERLLVCALRMQCLQISSTMVLVLQSPGGIPLCPARTARHSDVLCASGMRRACGMRRAGGCIPSCMRAACNVPYDADELPDCGTVELQRNAVLTSHLMPTLTCNVAFCDSERRASP